MSKEQSELDRKVQESLEKFLMETIGKEPFQSFSRYGEMPVPWIHWLDAVGQQNVNKLSKVGKVQELDAKEHGQEKNIHIDCSSSVFNGLKESIPNNRKETEAIVRGFQIPSEHSHSLKIPQAVVAFAYAAVMANGFAGWPSLVPSNMQMIKCDKCCREFCSSLNHRRHVRMHRRPLNVVKEDVTNEIANLAAFWDELSSDMAKQIVSFNDIMLQEVRGALIIKALTSLMQQPGFPLSPKYLKAGAALLDVVQCKSSRFPLPAEDLFNILEDATEKTFLCTGISVSEQKFVFEGETRKLGLEVKNLVASVGFLVEQRLVEAWITGKNAEALRLQKELVEEEEIARKRQAELLERKRLKKIKQKQLKEKDSTNLTAGNSSQLPVCSTYDSPSAVVDMRETQDAGHLGYNDTDLEQRDSQSLAPERSLNSDQGEENKSYTEDYLQSGRPVLDPKSKRLKHKHSNQQTSPQAMKKSNVILKPLSGNRFHEHESESLGLRMTSETLEHPMSLKNVAQTMISDLNKAAKFEECSKDKLVKPMQSLLDASAIRPTSKSTPEIEQKGMTIITVETGSTTRGQKGQQTSASHSQKSVKYEVCSKDDADANVVGIPVEPICSLSGGNSLGPTCQGISGVKQKGFDICTTETGNTRYGQNMEQISASLIEKSASSEKSSKEEGRIKEDQSSMASALGAKGDDNLGNQSQNMASDRGCILEEARNTEEIQEGHDYDVNDCENFRTFLYQRWEDATADTEAVILNSDSGVEEEDADTEEIVTTDLNSCTKVVNLDAEAVGVLDPDFEGEDVIAKIQSVGVLDPDTEATVVRHSDFCVAHASDETQPIGVPDPDFEGEDAIGKIQSVGVLDPDTEATIVRDSDCGVEHAGDETQAIGVPDPNFEGEDVIGKIQSVGVPDPDTEAIIVQDSDCGVEHGSDETRVIGVPDPDFEKEDAIGKAQSAVVLHPDTEATIVRDSDCGAENVSDETQAIGVPDPDFEGEDVIGKIQSVDILDPDTEATIVQDSDCGVQDASYETQAICVPDPDFEEEDVIGEIQSVGVLVPDLSGKDTAAETQTICGQDGNSGLEVAATETHITVVIEDPDSGILEDPDSTARESIPGDSAQVYSRDRDSSSGER